MEYHLKVLQPFARDPAYYASVITGESDTPAKEGPVIHGAIKLYDYPVWPRTGLDTVQPLSPAQSADLAAKLRTIAPLLDAARTNLAAGNAARSVGRRGAGIRRPKRRAAHAGRPRAGERQRAVERHRVCALRHQRLRGMAARRSAEEDRPVRHRQGAVHLVPPQRAAGAAVVGGRGHHPASRTGASPRLAAARGEPQPRSCRRCRSRTRPRPMPRCRSRRFRAT